MEVPSPVQLTGPSPEDLQQFDKRCVDRFFVHCCKCSHSPSSSSAHPRDKAHCYVEIHSPRYNPIALSVLPPCWAMCLLDTTRIPNHCHCFSETPPDRYGLLLPAWDVYLSPLNSKQSQNPDRHLKEQFENIVSSQLDCHLASPLQEIESPFPPWWILQSLFQICAQASSCCACLS